MPAQALKSWQEALNKAIGSTIITGLPNTSAALIVAIQQDQLFDGASFNSSLSQAMCERLSSTPSSAVEMVSGARSQNSAEDDYRAAIALITYDGLYVNNQFQENVWNGLVEEYKKSKLPAKNQ